MFSKNFKVYGMRPAVAKKALKNEPIALKINMYLILVALFIAAFILSQFYEERWSNAHKLQSTFARKCAAET